MERFLERLLFSSRWILAPVYLGLALALIALAITFFAEIFNVFGHVFHNVLSHASGAAEAVPTSGPSRNPEAELILSLLAMVDLVLVGSLIVMVMFSGYENFVSKMDIDEDGEKLGWLGARSWMLARCRTTSSCGMCSSISRSSFRHCSWAFWTRSRLPRIAKSRRANTIEG
jgi:uncharacterized membrane protein YqhA